EGVHATGAFNAPDGALERITDATIAGELTVPIARDFEPDAILAALALQSTRTDRGKTTIRMCRTNDASPALSQGDTGEGLKHFASRLARCCRRTSLEVPVLVMGRGIMRNLRGCSEAVPSACHS